MAETSGSSRTTFLAYQSPGALSAADYQQLQADANGKGPKAGEAAHAAVALKENPAAKGVAGAHGTLAGDFAARSQTASNLSGRDDRTANSGFNINSGMGAMALAQFAAQQGVGWAKDKPELMNLGPQAIQALADVKLSQTSFERLQKDADFTAKDVVDLARFSKKKDIDANKLSGDVSVLLKDLPKDERTQARDSLTGYFRNPDDPKAGQKLNDTLNKIESAHPEKAGQVGQLKQTMKLQEGAEQQAAIRQKGALDSFNNSTAKPEQAPAAPADTTTAKPAAPSYTP